MLDISSERSISLLAYSITLIILSTIAVILRLISRIISVAGLWWDDIVIIIGLLNSYAAYAIVFIGVHNGLGHHIQTVSMLQRVVLLKTIYASQVHYPFSISTIKLAILIFYLRLFGSRKGFRKMIFATIALVISWCIGTIFPAIFVCTPISFAIFDTLYPQQNCINVNAYLISTSIFNVLLDIWILILPCFIVWTLQLSSKRKAGVCGIFLLGAFTIGASIAKIYTVLNVEFVDITWSAATPTIWGSVEISVAIICACLPTLQPVLGVLGRKFQETTSSSSRLARKDNDLYHLESQEIQRGTPPKSNVTMASSGLSRGNSSWRAHDHKSFERATALEEVEMSNSSPP